MISTPGQPLRGAVLLFAGYAQDLHEDSGMRRLHRKIEHQYQGRDLPVRLYEWHDDIAHEAARLAQDVDEDPGGRVCVVCYSRGWEGMARFCRAYARPVAWVGAIDPCPVRGFGLANALNWISWGAWFDELRLPGNVRRADAWRQTWDRPRGRLVQPSRVGQRLELHEVTSGPGHSDMDELGAIHATALERIGEALRSAA